MSERGSFVTEFVYCNKCFLALKAFMLNDVNFEAVQVNDQPIIAGKVRAGFIGEEHLVVEEFLTYMKNEGLLCHEVRVAVIPDSESIPIKTHTTGEEDVEST